MFIADSVLLLIGAVLFAVVGSLVVFRSEDKHLIACLRSDIRHLAGQIQEAETADYFTNWQSAEQEVFRLKSNWDDACQEFWNQAEQKCEERWGEENRRLRAAHAALLQSHEDLKRAHKDMADFYGVIRVAD
jgi:hypothetical protein